MSIPKPDGPNIDIGPPMLATCWTLYGIAGAIVGMRVFTQVKVTRNFGIGDIIMMGAMFMGFLHMIFLTLSHHYGLGRHFFYLDDYQRVKAMEWEFISEPFGILTSTLGRTSFVVLMFRLFGTTKFRQWFLYFLIAETIIINLMTCITIFVQCGKVESLWDPVGTPSKCWPPTVQADIGYFQGGMFVVQASYHVTNSIIACNSLTDLTLTFLPSTIFFTLQMKLRIKLGLAALLGLSIFAFAASIVKTVKLQSLGERSDYSFNTVNFMNWVVIENTFVIIAASIPLLRPLFNIAKASAMTHYGGSSYEMNSRTHGSKAFASVHTQSKSIALQSSSEENILPVQGTTRSVTNIASNHPKVDRESRDVEKGNAAGITRETTIQVLYEEGNGRGTPAGSKWGLAK